MTEPASAFGRFLRDYAHVSEADPRLVETAEFGANPGNLRMLCYAPDDLPIRAPLVVVLHGCTQSASAYAAGAGWLDLAERQGFAVLSPEQRADNNFNRCFNWFEPGDATRGGGEAASILAMIDHAIAEHALDPARVYVTGLSAGGAMTSALLASYPERFAAGAVVAGLPYGSAGNMQQALGAMMQGRKRAPAEWGDYVRAGSQHKGPWPRVSIWHGDADTTVTPANALSVAAQWANVHGAGESPAWSEMRGARTYSAWGPRDAPLVELHLLAGLAHGTPISLTGPDPIGAAGPYLLEADVSSSSEIAAFWGLATPPVRVPAPRKAPAKSVVAPEPLITAPALAAPLQAKKKTGGVDIGAVIKKALTAAGLMKR